MENLNELIIKNQEKKEKLIFNYDSSEDEN